MIIRVTLASVNLDKDQKCFTLVRGFGGWVRLLGSGAGSLDLRGSEAAERKQESKEWSWENPQLLYTPSEPGWETFSWHGMGKVLVCWGGLGRAPLAQDLSWFALERRPDDGTPRPVSGTQLVLGFVDGKGRQVFLSPGP